MTYYYNVVSGPPRVFDLQWNTINIIPRAKSKIPKRSKFVVAQRITIFEQRA